jgi:hypothetical protein
MADLSDVASAKSEGHRSQQRKRTSTKRIECKTMELHTYRRVDEHAAGTRS